MSSSGSVLCLLLGGFELISFETFVYDVMYGGLIVLCVLCMFGHWPI